MEVVTDRFVISGDATADENSVIYWRVIDDLVAINGPMGTFPIPLDELEKVVSALRRIQQFQADVK